MSTTYSVTLSESPKRKNASRFKRGTKRKKVSEVIDVSDDDSKCKIVEPASKKGKESKG